MALGTSYQDPRGLGILGPPSMQGTVVLVASGAKVLGTGEEVWQLGMPSFPAFIGAGLQGQGHGQAQKVSAYTQQFHIDFNLHG